MTRRAPRSKELAQVPSDVARASFGDLITRAGFLGERILITRHGKPVVALVSVQDAERLEQIRRGAEPRKQIA